VITKKISHLDDVRRKKREKTGLTKKEVKERGKKFLENNKHLDKKEPANLVSGDMDKIIRGEDDGDDD
jgi:hypothetical protein